MKAMGRAGCVLSLAVLATTMAYAVDEKPKQEAVTAEEVRALRALLEAQREELRQLRQEVRQMQRERAQAADALRVAGEAQEKADAVQTASSRQQASVSRLEGEVSDLQADLSKAATTTKEEQKRVAGLEGIVNRFRFTGDVRVRYENFYQEGVPTRHRPRIRLRFGVEGKLGEDFYGGIALASGAVVNGNPSLTDPVSTNETLTSFFERKTVGFDRGWITYQPQAHKWLQLTGGKFAYTWARTAMTLDNDLNPEGFSQKLSFDVKNPVVRNLNFTGMQIFFSEVSGSRDSFAAGAQVGSRLQLGKRVTIAPSYSLLNWHNADVIAQAAGPLGGAPGVIRANTLSNATRTCGAGGDPACRVTTGAATREFLSTFLYSDFIVDTNVKTPWEKWPVRLLLEYEKNLNAFDSQDAAFWGELVFGQTRNKNDLQFGYSFTRIERDALISQFNESDMRAATNVLQHRLYALWNMQHNVTAGYTLWVGRTLDCRLQGAALANGFTCNLAPPFNTEPYLKRMQFDLIYKF